MYEKFFKLDSKPFELVPNPSFLFLSSSHKKALSYLEYGIQEGAGFILFTGEVGAGKTTIIRNLVKQLDAQTALAMVFNTRVSAEQLLALVNDDFGLDVNGRDKVGLLHDLNDYLVQKNSEGCRPILIIDEAQNLSSEALEEIRLLSNLEGNNCKLLQIILVGQPELKRIIAQPCLRQLRQRISISCHLNPLKRDETEQYIYHRLETAGNRHAVSFQEGTFDIIYRYSHGVPRLVNIFCDFLLLSAFVEETRHLSLELVEEVIGDVAKETDYEGQNAQFSPSLVTGEPLGRIEELDDDRKALIDRVTRQENILRAIIERQKADTRRLETLLSRIASQLDSLAQKMERGKPLRVEMSRGKERPVAENGVFGWKALGTYADSRGDLNGEPGMGGPFTRIKD